MYDGQKLFTEEEQRVGSSLILTLISWKLELIQIYVIVLIFWLFFSDLRLTRGKLLELLRDPNNDLITVENEFKNYLALLQGEPLPWRKIESF